MLCDLIERPMDRIPRYIRTYLYLYIPSCLNNWKPELRGTSKQVLGILKSVCKSKFVNGWMNAL